MQPFPIILCLLSSTISLPIALGLTTITTTPPGHKYIEPPMIPGDADGTILSLINGLRTQHGNPVLATDPALKTAAKQCADELVVTNVADTVEDVDPTIDQTQKCKSDAVKGLLYFSLQDQGPTDELLAYDSVRTWIREGDQTQIWTTLTYIAEDRHFSQLLWAGTTKLGCAVSTKATLTGKKIFACYFNPAGNLIAGHSNLYFKINLGLPNKSV